MPKGTRNIYQRLRSKNQEQSTFLSKMNEPSLSRLTSVTFVRSERNTITNKLPAVTWWTLRRRMRWLVGDEFPHGSSSQIISPALAMTLDISHPPQLQWLVVRYPGLAKSFRHAGAHQTVVTKAECLLRGIIFQCGS